MKRWQSLAWRGVWAVLALVTLSGCDALKGFGEALAGTFKSIKLP